MDSSAVFCPLDKIEETWEQARASVEAELRSDAEEQLPAWGALSLAMRVALIRVWAGGEKHAAGDSGTKS